jgi:hypothetical protein
MFLMDLPRSVEDHTHDLFGRSHVDRLATAPVTDDKDGEPWTP